MKRRIKWRKPNLVRIMTVFVFGTLVISAVYSAVHVIFAESVADEVYEKVKSDYVLMLIQCVLGIIVMFLPSLLEKRFRLDIPSPMYVLFIIFLYCAIYLGEVQSFYYLIPQWDTILHTLSGGILGALGFSVVHLLNENERVTVHLSPMFLSVFAFCFAMTLGALWEIYEFSFDGLLNLNMQKFALQDGTPLLGRAALSDTMKDLIVDMMGALIVVILGYFSLKRHSGWFENFEVTRQEKTYKL